MGFIERLPSSDVDSGNFGYLAFAFVAGLNVDKFVLKIEEISKATFGIEKSRSGSKDDKE